MTKTARILNRLGALSITVGMVLIAAAPAAASDAGGDMVAQGVGLVTGAANTLNQTMVGAILVFFGGLMLVFVALKELASRRFTKTIIAMSETHAEQNRQMQKQLGKFSGEIAGLRNQLRFWRERERDHDHDAERTHNN